MKLPSGAELEITLSPFKISKKLYQTILKAMKGLEIDPGMEVDVSFIKDMMCELLSNEEVELALDECMKRVKYNGHRISEDTFEDEKARQDYILVCKEVALRNVLPFMKNLFAVLGTAQEEINTLIQE